MAFQELPDFAAWRHRDVRDGFEVVFLRGGPDGREFHGETTAVESGRAWAVQYTIVVAADWVTRSAHVVGWSPSGRREVQLEGDGSGGWLVDGTSMPRLQGCLDVDLESSSFTNMLPVHRLNLDVGQSADAPAVYVRAHDLAVERLEQRYSRIEDEELHRRYNYSAPRFEYAGCLEYDSHGLLLDYPGLAVRVL